jgi:hypothetical protein
LAECRSISCSGFQLLKLSQREDPWAWLEIILLAIHPFRPSPARFRWVVRGGLYEG